MNRLRCSLLAALAHSCQLCTHALFFFGCSYLICKCRWCYLIKCIIKINKHVYLHDTFYFTGTHIIMEWLNKQLTCSGHIVAIQGGASKRTVVFLNCCDNVWLHGSGFICRYNYFVFDNDAARTTTDGSNTTRDINKAHNNDSYN